MPGATVIGSAGDTTKAELKSDTSLLRENASKCPYCGVVGGEHLPLCPEKLGPIALENCVGQKHCGSCMLLLSCTKSHPVHKKAAIDAKARQDAKVKK